VLVVTGVGHLLVTVASKPGAGHDTAFRELRAAVVELGPERSLDQLFRGFSLAMAVLLVAFGILLLAAGPIRAVLGTA
jgi:hypothetical protein